MQTMNDQLFDAQLKLADEGRISSAFFLADCLEYIEFLKKELEELLHKTHTLHSEYADLEHKYKLLEKPVNEYDNQLSRITAVTTPSFLFEQLQLNRLSVSINGGYQTNDFIQKIITNQYIGDLVCEKTVNNISGATSYNLVKYPTELLTLFKIFEEWKNDVETNNFDAEDLRAYKKSLYFYLFSVSFFIIPSDTHITKEVEK